MPTHARAHTSIDTEAKYLSKMQQFLSPLLPRFLCTLFSKISLLPLLRGQRGRGGRWAMCVRLLFVAGRQNIPITPFQREEYPPYLTHKTIKARRLAGSAVLFCSILFSAPSSETNRVVKLAFLGCGNVPMGCFQSCCILSFLCRLQKGRLKAKHESAFFLSPRSPTLLGISAHARTHPNMFVPCV